MGLLGLLFKDPVTFVLLVPLLLYSVIAHEVAHGWVASWFGDKTAKYAGRLSLNPKDHLDPIGTLAIFLVGFGWAKPVPVDYLSLRSRRAMISVSLAGCLVNIIIATLAIFLLQFTFIRTNQWLGVIFVITARINITLGALNLIPIPPLDGYRVLSEFLPVDFKYRLMRLEPYGFFIIIGLLWLGILGPVISFVYNLILGLIGILLSFTGR